MVQFIPLSVDTAKKHLRNRRNRLNERKLGMGKENLHEQAPSRDDDPVNVVSLCSAAEAGDLPRVQKILAHNPHSPSHTRTRAALCSVSRLLQHR